nr:ORF 1 [Escherichia coli]
MDTIDLGNNESLVYGVFPNQDGTFTAMTYTKSKTFKTENGARRWLERNSGEMDFDTIMEKAYEEYFEGLAEGEEALSFSEFKQALSSSAKSNG